MELSMEDQIRESNMQMVAINRATDYKKWISGFIMLSFSLIGFLRWNSSGELFFLLLTFRDLIAGIFLLRRERAIKTSTNFIAIIAYVSSFLPLIYLSAPYGIESNLIKLVADLLAITGFLVVTWATIDLGTKIGISPAKRGDPCRKGLYRYISHPMYLGYGVAQIGFIFLNKWNLIIFFTSVLLFYIRSLYENKVLNS
ncbi:MAG: protein-S-isoprenylcysteine O-methyltransferase Ste14 [Bacteriovoracaceae bacterium]|jgi:protein-S-isoprenylcysteine O-methyltransferase Ste14